MLSDRALERVSVSYRNGYRDGYCGREARTPRTGIGEISVSSVSGVIRPFADFDYDSGYSAGKNDAKWANA